MKNTKFTLFLLFLLLVNIVPVHANEFISAKDNLSIEIEYKNNNVPMNDITFELYHIADMSDNVILSWSDSFKQFESLIDLNQLDQGGYKEVADTLEAYIIYHDIKPMQIKQTNQQGTLKFDQPLNQGLYLILSQKHYHNGRTYSVSPSLISLPQYLNSHWNGQVVVSPKYEDIGEDTRITVIKQWDDQYNLVNRPVSIKVALLKDNQVFDEYILSKDNNWRIVIEDLEAGYEYRIVEVEVENGYKVSIQKDGKVFILKNTLDNPPPKLDQTGVPWWPVPILMSLGFSFIIIGLYINKKSRIDEG